MNKRKFWHIFLKIRVNYCNRLYIQKYPSCKNEISKDELLDPPLVSGFYLLPALLIYTFQIVATSVPAILCHFTFDGISIRVIQKKKFSLRIYNILL